MNPRAYALRALYDAETRRDVCADCRRTLATGQATCICGARREPTCCGDPADCHNANGGGC